MRKFMSKTSVKILAVFVILACGPIPLDLGEFFSLFYPENATSPTETNPYFYTPLVLNEDTEAYYTAAEEGKPKESLEQKLNVEAWQGHLKNKVGAKELQMGLYESGKLLGLVKKVKSIDAEAASYLQFCAEVDGNSPVQRYYWEEPVPVDSSKLVALYNQALSEKLQASSAFLKERYEFQFIKLGAILGLNKEVLDASKKGAISVKDQTFISEWSESRLAGIKMAMGDTAKAVCQFAQVFAKSPTRRYQADLSVRRLSTKWFEESLVFAKSDDEKANVYALWAIQPFQDGLHLGEKIYALNPNHPMLELVFAREINKNEKTFFAERNARIYIFDTKYTDDEGKIDEIKIDKAQKEGEQYIVQLQGFANTVLSEEKNKSLDFWRLSLAYLYYLKGDIEKGSALVAQMKVSENPFINKQAAFLEFEFLDKVYTPETESILMDKAAAFAEVKTFRDNNFRQKISESLYTFYIKPKTQKRSTWGWLTSCSTQDEHFENQDVKGFLALQMGATTGGEYGYELSKTQNFYVDTCSSGFLKKVIAFVHSSKLNPAEKKLVNYAHLEPEYLELALVRALVSEGDYAEASAQISKISDAYLELNGFTDYFYSDAKDFNFNKKTKGADPKYFLRNLADINTKVKANKATADELYALGKMQYNLGYFGNGWLLQKREKSELDLRYIEDISGNYYTNREAIASFEMALSMNPEIELAAKICYAGALCERNQYLVKFYEGYPEDYEKEEAYIANMKAQELPKFRSYFTKLWQNYQDTQYQKQVLKECQTYAQITR